MYPIPSWPVMSGLRGTFGAGGSPSRGFISPAQIPAASSLMRASPTPGLGIGQVVSRVWGEP